MSRRPPQDCTEMSQVREAIDEIDIQLVDLVAQRFGYVDRAWQIKQHGPEGAVVPWRIQQVIDKVRQQAENSDLPPDLAEAMWRQMIGWFIQYEEEQLARSAKAGKDPENPA
ncbi:MAG: chorismate mutase [Filomicrobium sp.]